MFSRCHISIVLALLLSLVFAVPVFAGGWAVITLDELPSNSVAGEPLRIGFTVLQHGRTPMTNLEPTVTAGLALDEKLVVYAEPEGKPGHYVATLTFPKEGEWEWSIQAFTMDQSMPVLSVAAPGAVSASQPVKTELATPSLSPLVIVRTLALGIGLIGLVVAFRRRSRLAAGLTAFCLVIGFALFIAGAGTASGLEAQSKASEVLSASSAAQVELGRQLFIAKGCITCHVNSKAASSSEYWTIPVGTNLSNFSASPEVLFVRLKDPSAAKSDTQMPNLDLTKVEIEALVAFINSK
ncbi:MAG TPA: c-type cytochrome [Anaerolineales bacterium]